MSNLFTNDKRLKTGQSGKEKDIIQMKMSKERKRSGLARKDTVSGIRSPNTPATPVSQSPFGAKNLKDSFEDQNETMIADVRVQRKALKGQEDTRAQRNKERMALKLEATEAEDVQLTNRPLLSPKEDP